MRKEKDMKEYLSGVRHDLRGKVVIVRERISQVLDGFGNEDCGKCFKILKNVLKDSDKLNSLISELLDISRFKNKRKRGHPGKNKRGHPAR